MKEMQLRLPSEYQTFVFRCPSCNEPMPVGAIDWDMQRFVCSCGEHGRVQELSLKPIG